MNIFTGILVFVMIWWVVLFTVLPWGIRVPDEHEPGHATSATSNPRLIRKALITTAITIVFWSIAYYLIEGDLITFRPS